MKTHNNQPKISQSTITNLSVVDIEELFEELTQEEMAGIMGGGLPSIGQPPYPSPSGLPSIGQPSYPSPSGLVSIGQSPYRNRATSV